MAGSRDSVVHSVLHDPIIQARIESLGQLADGLSERVAVLDREFNVVYANEAAWGESPERTTAVRPAKCYQAFINQQDPCASWPATTVFETRQAVTLSGSLHGQEAACAMRRAFPLKSGMGNVGSVLVLFKNGSVRRQVGVGPAEFLHSDGEVVPEAARLGRLIGQSPPMRELFHMIRLVADSSATVLIHGESGTGKELVAKTIHESSFRRTKLFVVVDCGSLPETLLESELFGHVKGAFTGAVSNKRGLFEEADGGTLFLDEIADTTPSFQAKLLRVLQEGELKRVGSSRPIKIDVRVISATNKDLTGLLQAKVFRQDLYYRLTDEVMHALTEAQWPGNVRELQHYIERAVVTANGPELSCKDIVAIGSGSESSDLRTAVRGAAQQVEMTRIIDALRLASGNRGPRGQTAQDQPGKSV